tara:strand:- start:4501 stop:5988 length:1488 start_codon:yes stop_codon:yes gene_type:complete
MGTTVAQIVDTAFLRTKFLAGLRGASRPVVWAHTCELPDPWNWLGEGELLLSDGYNFPADADKQVEFLERLAAAKLAGLALAAGMHAPPLMPKAVEAANSLPFPVLETEYDVPFVAVARAVAERNSRASVASLTKILSVYDRLHRTERVPVRRGLLEQLEMEAGADLHVIDAATGQALLESRTTLSESASLAVVDAIQQRQGPLPGFTRVTVGEERVLVIPLSRSSAVLVAEPLTTSGSVDVPLLQHIATIAELEIARQVQDSEASRVASAQLFSRMLDGGLGNEGAEALLEIAGFRPGDRRLIAIRSTGRTPAIHKRLLHDGVTHLLLNRGGLDLILTDSPGAVLDRITDDKSAEYAGISLQISSTDRLPDAVRESKWALEAAISSKSAVVTYGDYSAPFLPRTPEEARLVVDRILGPIITYDQSENAGLLQTLEAFFDADRSWQIAAQQLRVHKQTVVYRIRRIESLTGRTLRDVSDQTDLFLALRVRKLLAI